MERVGTSVGRFAKGVIGVFFTVIIAILTLQSLFSTAYISSSEKTYYAADKPWRHFLVFLVFLVVLYAVRLMAKKISCKNKVDNIAAMFFMFLSVAAGFLIFYTTQLYPRADQRLVLLTAAQLREGDFSAFEPNGYLAIWPHQMGTVLYQYYLSFLTGINNHVGVQLWNVCMLGVFEFFFYKLIRKTFATLSGIATMLAIVTYLPLVFYVSFVYGNLAGLAFSTIALYCLVQFKQTRRILYIIFAVAALWLAILIKGNYLIVLIAMFLYLLIDLLTSRDKKTILFLVALVVCLLWNQFFITAATKHITGREIPTGVPTITWVAMGLQEGYGAKGWYNEYVRQVYDTYGGNTEQIEEAAWADIKSSLEGFASDGVMTRQFFGEKINSQWNNPTFQCFWIFNDRETDIQVPAWMKNLLTGTWKNELISVMNLWQMLLLLGVCAYICLALRYSDWSELLLAMFFIGGFIFHLFWEGKCQYTVTYFPLLIPYALMGYDKLLEGMDRMIGACKASGGEHKSLLQILVKQRVTWLIAGFAVIVMMGTLYQGAWFTDTIKITKDHDRFQEKMIKMEVNW